MKANSILDNPAIPPLPKDVFVPPFPPPNMGYLPYIKGNNEMEFDQPNLKRQKTSKFEPRKPLIKVQEDHKFKPLGWKRVLLDPN